MLIEIPDKLLLASPCAMFLYVHLAVNGGEAKSHTQLMSWAGKEGYRARHLTELKKLGLISWRGPHAPRQGTGDKIRIITGELT